MVYSKIDSIRVKNFRNIGDVTVSFKESPIVTLMGENEAGKTSIVKAIAVVGANAYPMRQTKFIRTGTAGWGVQVDFEDGSCLVRQRGTPNSGIGNVLATRTADGVVNSDNKIDRGEGIPVAMQKYMGFMVEPETGELLNVRTYEDALMFVVTPDSTNYKVLYNALKVGQVTRAIKAGNKESSALRSEIDSISVKMDEVLDTLKSIVVSDMEPVNGIRSRTEAEVAKLTALNKAAEAKAKLTHTLADAGGYAVVESLTAIDAAVPTMFSRAVELLENLRAAKVEDEQYEYIGNPSTIDVGIANMLIRAIGNFGAMWAAKTESSKYTEIASMGTLDATLVQKLSDCMGRKSAIAVSCKEVEEAEKGVKETMEALAATGENVGWCSKCGNLVVVENVCSHNTVI